MTDPATPPASPAGAPPPPTALVPAAPAADTGLTRKDLANSRLYPHINTPEKAAVVISKAKAWGLEASCVAEAMYFPSGKPALSANMHAVLVKRSGRYDYRVREKNRTRAVLEFFERIDGKWEAIGTETFTMEDAQTAGLTNNPSWKKFGPAMLFARCLTAGVRTHCPDVLAGTCCYSIEELAPNAEYDEEGRPVVTVQAEPAAAPADPAEFDRLVAASGAKPAVVLTYLGVERPEDVTAADLERLRQFVSLKNKSVKE